MQLTTRSIVAMFAVACLVAGCGEDDPVEPEGPFDLTFAGNATFQGPHADMAIMVALVSDDGTVLDVMSGVIAAAADPTFSFTFEDLLEEGESYEVHYWIDANFAGGTVGVCDAPPDDHTWSVSITDVQADVTITEGHDVSDLTDVCATFA